MIARTPTTVQIKPLPCIYLPPNFTWSRRESNPPKVACKATIAPLQFLPRECSVVSPTWLALVCALFVTVGADDFTFCDLNL